jgi:archaellum component FlaC
MKSKQIWLIGNALQRAFNLGQLHTTQLSTSLTEALTTLDSYKTMVKTTMEALQQIDELTPAQQNTYEARIEELESQVKALKSILEMERGISRQNPFETHEKGPLC